MPPPQVFKGAKQGRPTRGHPENARYTTRKLTKQYWGLYLRSALLVNLLWKTVKSQWWCVLPLSMVARLTPVLFLSAATFLSFFLFSFRLPIQRKFLTMPPDLQSSSEATPTTSLGNSPDRMQTILYYTSWWLDHASPKTWDLGEGSSPFAHCIMGKL